LPPRYPLKAKWYESIVKTIREPLIVLTPGLKVISANCFFYETFPVAPEETEGIFIFDVGNHQWDIPVFFLLQGNGFFDKLVANLTESPLPR